MLTDRSPGSVAEELVRLGFSTYEARTYVGLLLGEGSTGYRISNQTGVPQPKVYETLRRLVERGAAAQTQSRPARYAAVPPADLLARLERDFRRRLERARTGLEGLPQGVESGRALAVQRLDSLSQGLERAREAIEGAQTRVYLHARRDELKPLAQAVEAASARGVEFVLLHFGALPFSAPSGRVIRHASTEGTLYSSRRVRHLAVAVDSRFALWLLAREGQPDQGFCADSPLLASLLKAYIRHDLFVQRIYSDFPAELEAEYGPGLLSLTDFGAEEGGEELSDLTG
ncbi:MAG: TrmB family transcriptional regulator [Candidatus Dormibacteria bacterium]